MYVFTFYDLVGRKYFKELSNNNNYIQTAYATYMRRNRHDIAVRFDSLPTNKQSDQLRSRCAKKLSINNDVVSSHIVHMYVHRECDIPYVCIFLQFIHIYLHVYMIYVYR